jgi:hypothetical protein
LRHCHGFLADSLAGDHVGVVEEVETDPQTGDTSTLIVGCGWFGRRRLVIPVDDVDIVLPSDRRLFLSRAPAARA